MSRQPKHGMWVPVPLAIVCYIQALTSVIVSGADAGEREVVDLQKATVVQLKSGYLPTAEKRQPANPRLYRTLLKHQHSQFSAHFNRFELKDEPDPVFQVYVSHENSHRHDQSVLFYTLWGDLRMNDVIPFVDGLYRLSGLRKMPGQKASVLELTRLPHGHDEQFRLSPNSFVVPDDARQVKVIRHRMFAFVNLRGITTDGVGEHTAKLYISRTEDRGIPKTCEVRVDDRVFLQSGWHRVVNIVPRSIRKRRAGWVELDRRVVETPNIQIRAIASAPRRYAYRAGGYEIHRQIGRSAPGGPFRVVDLSVRLPVEQFGEIPVVINYPPVTEGKHVPIFNRTFWRPIELRPFNEDPTLSKREDETLILRPFYNNTVVIRPRLSVPRLDSVVVPVRDGTRGWLGVGDRGTASPPPQDRRVDRNEQPKLPELRYRLTVQSTIGRKKAIVKLQTPKKTLQRELSLQEEFALGPLRLRLIRIQPAEKGLEHNWIPWVEFQPWVTSE